MTNLTGSDEIPYQCDACSTPGYGLDTKCECSPSDPAPEMAALRAALAPLVAIADAYDDNALDDEARKFWGLNSEHENDRRPENIELYAGRGGKRLLTLADCLAARSAINKEKRP
ncbi:hypothetical protein [Rhizobium sp. SG741]|uniref:hypothetical protein n=1 Tax=Rhizobium sp. SG741 TaxID=2587114 RepID=UPI0014478176|nr:hypothetical protein [Rhizobium sp. SG741]NKJ03089.1 hypothetical protein [Rhizobium sp. SG741]